MNPEIRTGVEAQLKRINEMKQAKEIEPNDYYKCLVCLGYEYIKGDEINMGLYLLNQCAPEYFLNEQLKQMQEDEMYCSIVVDLAAMVQRHGIVDYVIDGLAPTQPPGAA